MKKYTVKFLGYDTYELNADLGPGEMIDSHEYDGRAIPLRTFDSIDACLKYLTETIGTEYHMDDWNFEEDLDDKGNNGWVMHIIVERDTMKYATDEMIEDWKNNGETDLIDLLVNVFVEETEI